MFRVQGTSLEAWLGEDSPLTPGGYAAGSRIAGYLLEEQIGQGGMAVVFRALDERLDRQVALKILAPALAADEAFRQRFIRESRAAAAVDDPHIIPVFEAGEANGVLFIAMRYVRGGDVRSLVRELGPLPPDRAAEIVSQVAMALDMAHSRGLVHRDVKPANMLLNASSADDRPDHVYLSDFGLSKASLTVTALTATGQFLGTLDYVAPEQIEGRPVDGRADEYALACTAFELLTGTPPFRRPEAMAVMHAQMYEPPPRLTSVRPDLPAAADQIFARALAKAPADRYASCREFAGAMRRALGLAASVSAPDLQGPDLQGPDLQGPDLQGPDLHGPDLHEPAAGLGSSASGPATERGRPVVGGLVGGMGGGLAAGAAGPPSSAATRPDSQASGPAQAGVAQPAGSRPSQRPGPLILVGVAIVAAAGIIAAAILALSPGSGTTANSPPAGSTGTTPATTGSPRTGVTGAGGPASASLPHYRRVRTLSSPASGTAVKSVALSPDAMLVATGDSNGSAYLWNAATGSRHGAPLTPRGAKEILAVAFSPDGTILATGGKNGTTYLWDVATGHLTATLPDPGSNGEVNAVAFSPHGAMLAAGNSNGHTYVWNVAAGTASGTPTTLAEPSGEGIWSAVFSSQGILATGDYGGSIYLWQAASGGITGLVLMPGGGYHPVTGLAFSGDGGLLATGDQNGISYLWNIARQTGRPISTTSAPVWGMAFTTTGRLAVGDGDGKTYLWQLGAASQSVTPVGTLPDPGAGPDGVGSVAVSGSGTWLVTGDSNGSTYLWHTG